MFDYCLGGGWGGGGGGGGKNLFNHKWGSVTHSLSLSPFYDLR